MNRSSGDRERNKPAHAIASTKSASDSDAPEIEFHRPRGCYTKLQREGLQLSASADIQHLAGGTYTIAIPGVFTYAVVVPEGRCTCDRYRTARPRIWCEHVWAIFYFLDPPTQDEFQIPEHGAALAPAIDASPERGMSAAALRAVDLASIPIGGWTKFRSAYEKAIQGEFGDVMDLFLIVVRQYAGDSLWKPPGEEKRGRHSYPLWLMLFAHFLHTFNNLTLRGTQGLLVFLARVGYLDAHATPAFAAIGAFIRSSSTSLIINDLMYLFASPFRSRTKLRLGADGTGWSQASTEITVKSTETRKRKLESMFGGARYSSQTSISSS